MEVHRGSYKMSLLESMSSMAMYLGFGEKLLALDCFNLRDILSGGERCGWMVGWGGNSTGRPLRAVPCVCALVLAFSI